MFKKSSTEISTATAAKLKAGEREQLEKDVAAFIAGGGQITQHETKRYTAEEIRQKSEACFDASFHATNANIFGR